MALLNYQDAWRQIAEYEKRRPKSIATPDGNITTASTEEEDMVNHSLKLNMSILRSFEKVLAWFENCQEPK